MEFGVWGFRELAETSWPLRFGSGFKFQGLGIVVSSTWILLARLQANGHLVDGDSESSKRRPWPRKAAVSFLVRSSS